MSQISVQVLKLDPSRVSVGTSTVSALLAVGQIVPSGTLAIAARLTLRGRIVGFELIPHGINHGFARFAGFVEQTDIAGITNALLGDAGIHNQRRFTAGGAGCPGP